MPADRRPVQVQECCVQLGMRGYVISRGANLNAASHKKQAVLLMQRTKKRKQRGKENGDQAKGCLMHTERHQS